MLPDAPESRYLYALLASNEFQEGLKNYRELNLMSRNLETWREDLSAFDDISIHASMRTTERVPKADAVIGGDRSRRPDAQRVEFESRINEIEKSNDVAALGTPEEQTTWARLKRIEDYLLRIRTTRILRKCATSSASMKGVMYWRLRRASRRGCGTNAAR